jgi:hypothetical protein
MTVGAFVPKPNQILATLRDRIEARNAVNAVAWPHHVHIKRVRPACAAERHHQRPCRRRRFGAMLPSVVDCGSVITSRCCSSKAIFPATWQSRIKNSMLSFVCSGAPLMTFYPALEANNRPATLNPTSEKVFEDELTLASPHVDSTSHQMSLGYRAGLR